MATLQKIRNRGPLVVLVVGLALFAFVAGDVWKVFQPHQNSQDAGKVNGKTLSAMDYQQMVEEYTNIAQMRYGMTSLSDEMMTNVKDQAWQTYVNNQLLQAEAEKLGLQVTDAELQYVINNGAHPLLMQTPFVNQQTGRFDKDMLKMFLAEYAKMNPAQLPAETVEYYTKMANYWKYTEQALKDALLAEKYQNLLTKSIISNPVSAEMSFKGRTEETEVSLVAVPYSSIADKDVEITDKDLKALYDKKKEQYKQLVETRNVKYVDVKILPSDADRQAVQKDVTEFAGQLRETTDYVAFVRSTNSVVPFSEVPVSEKALPNDVALRLDSVAATGVVGPYYNQADDSYNVFKVIENVNVADSVQFRQIQVAAATAEKTEALADSVFQAIKAGANFEEVAKKYGQTGTASWISSQAWEGSAVDGESAVYINKLLSQPVNELTKLKIGQVYVILDVLAKKNVQNKYKVAIVKLPVTFSKETYNKAYNAFSQFVAQNTTLQDLEKNAENSGYTLIPREDMSSADNYVAGIRSTKEALRWIFGAKEGQVSPLYECGDNDHLLVVALEKVNKKGYRDMALVKEELRAELLRDKKAALLMDKMKGFKTLAQAQGMKDAVNDTVKHITFSAPAFISVTRASEPAINGVASKLAVNKVSAPIKGYAGVYMIQILNRAKTAETFDAKAEQYQQNMTNARLASQFIGDLYRKANVEDKRYLFF